MKVILVFDKHLARSIPELGFYLHIEDDSGNIRFVDLPGALTEPKARSIAIANGYVIDGFCHTVGGEK